MQNFIFIAVMLIQVVIFPTLAKTDENGRKAAELLGGLCYYGISDLERIDAMAKSLGWKLAPKAVLEANRPIDANGFKMWEAHNINGPVFVSINKGVGEKGEEINICSIVFNLSKDNLLSELKKEMVLGKEYKQKEPFQVLSTYTLKNPIVKKSYLQIIHDGRGGRPINAIMIGYK